MPYSSTSLAINAHKIILITGINGYIASHIGLLLLQRGYTVRGTSRHPSSAHRLLNGPSQNSSSPISPASDSHSTGPYYPYASQYQHVVVPDITLPGAFDDAVQGVYAIIHVASPVDFSLRTVDEFFTPAIQGNLSILNSALTSAGPQLSSFVLTSSIAAIADRWAHPSGHAYTEADWNVSGEAVARNPDTFSGPIAYGASKAVAERTMWKWRDEHNPPFACCAINPGVVTGPPVLWPETPEQLNMTLKPIWTIYAGERDVLPPQIGGAAYIDVRDVAELHVWAALTPEKSGGERYLATNGKAPPQAIADILRRKYPERRIVEGNPGEGYVPGTYWFPEGAVEGSAIAAKAYGVMGVGKGGFIGFEKSVVDSVEGMERKWPGKAKNFKE